MATSPRTTSRTPRVNAVGTPANPAEDSRVRHSPDSEGRGPRSQEDAARSSDEGTHLTVEQRRMSFRDEFRQEALPHVPGIPGWHLCWLSTTSSYDPIHKRMRLGYVPVRVEELVGFDSLKMKSGEFEGCISCNEMLLFKVPQEVYQEIMQEFHHYLPAEEEEALRARLVDNSAVDSRGKKLGQVTEDSDGFEAMRSRQRQGVFAG